VALGLIGDPELLFLDEPTTGFDPTARRQAWDIIKNLAELGKTVLLTTHYMDEAQTLADRVVVIAAGEIVAEGTPQSIGGRADAAAQIRFGLPPGVRVEDLPIAPDSVEDGIVLITTATPTALMGALARWAAVHGGELDGLTVIRPSLEDVYIALTDDVGPVEE
jgi:ABC-2 type transport system ATP-binding protein